MKRLVQILSGQQSLWHRSFGELGPQQSLQSSWVSPHQASTSGNMNASSSLRARFATGASGADVKSVMEGAAEQRLLRIKAAHEAGIDAAEKGLHGSQGEPKTSVIGRVLQSLVLLTAGTAVGGSAYYSYFYSAKEVETMVRETKDKQENDYLGSSYWWVPVMEEVYVPWRKWIENQLKTFRDPTYDRLLPDMRPEMKQMGIKTLVLDLNDVLVSKQWTRKKGWTLYKRPGAQDFLFEMGQYFEIVIFTDEPSAYAIPVINKLDKQQVVPYRLFRPETQYHEGKHVRDLSKLNRDLSQVLFISADPDAYMFQPGNTLKLKPWKDDPSDTTLLDLLPMLQMVALKGVKDVRDVVKAYDGEEDVAKAFKKRMQSMAQTQPKAKQGLLSFR
ncbi:hypothetical protein CEUSTIGMA_g4402.t1 [Chlamydomonas eustigma]|uniref:Mitochondrial import inner membrane translocase subunit TIM50 n=1 Tax=Chlamydomonas eustigma TaxID=1157962 RepID=A0A250X1M3_9CHLO|nr:hypothetical protein CEUSTIGMA_g4402.t1 [Chlamydomonas eustigma]|eukprot:GAX76955.1 hypothetical protein CEUSTIGMA_g4402.t1 [Chlamydomonas eustigma]